MKKNLTKTSLKHQPLKENRSVEIYKLFSGLALCSIAAVTGVVYAEENTPDAFTLRITTHGEGVNRSDNMSEPARQDNRRTDVKIKTKVQTGTRTVTDETFEEVNVKVSDAINRSIRLNDGGSIWVTKDPASLTPVLNVTSSQTVKMDSGKFETPLNFNIYTNYAYFIDTWELSVYRKADEAQEKPLVIFTGKDLDNGRVVKWNGSVDKGEKLLAGDEVTYVLTVKDKTGHFDETHLRTIRLAGPEENITEVQNDTSNTGKYDNNLARQTIPIQGSRVRIHGRDIATGNRVQVGEEQVSIVDNKFVVEKLLPDGKHQFDINIVDNNKEKYNKPLKVELDSKYMFMVGLADVTIGESEVKGNLETLSDGDERLDGDIFVDGRLAFYLKGKIKGKYLVTAQMDTGTAPIEDLFDDIHKKDPRSLFRRLDPDKYYPVYGDDSTLIDDTDSQGKLYVRVDWDKSRAIWGNYNTSITGTELSSFNRSLYGAKLAYKSTQITKEGDHKKALTVFASEAQSAFRHNQFLGTGGSLYYLKDTDIVDGSEKVWIEIRQKGSDRAISKIEMEEGRDYEIDDFQGRIILHRPLLQIAAQSNPSLIKDTPLDGDQVYLMVDYEYVPDDFATDKASYGANGKIWLTDTFAVGGTYAHENRDLDDYDLKGIDLTYKKGKGTYIKGEYAESESSQTQGSFFSEDGGLNFNSFNDTTSPPNKSGSAFSLEARANLQNFTNKEGSIGAWYKEREAGFSTSRLDNGEETIEAGLEAILKATEKLNASVRATLLDRKETLKTITASVQADYKLNDKTTLSGEIKHIKEEDYLDNTKDGDGTLAAFKVGYDLNKDVNLYAILQGTLNKSGAYEDNNLLTLGAKAKLSDKLDFNAEFSTGDRGEAGTLGASYKMSKDYSLYTNYTLSTDRTDGERNIFTVGQRRSVTNQLKVYTEHQFTHEDKQSGTGHTFGLDYDINKATTLNTSFQTARLDKRDTGLVDRDAFSVGLTHKNDKTDASTKLEYRRDKGTNESTEQWVTTNRISHRLSPSFRLQGKLNFSETKDKISSQLDARFVEAGFGFAYRPVHNDRLNLLGRLTYLYDLQPLSQSTLADEKSLTFSLEGNYQLNQKWGVGGKLAHKLGETRADRNAGAWEKNDATLAAARVRYHLTSKWDAMAEYHWMNSDESQDTQHGAMISLDRHIGKNMKIGIGYNFSDFDDDLSNTTGSTKGWFINLVGKY
ncbi:hypothetical protein [uncultured Cocleimonas sp.]|uniref:hypothetical protein n=1 Tax=uncultured Cocleimonas sp. TaxID=1051587 RepID=UPI0026377609|nr:hypothetical protein [uncultured Cocleimonas sp.]